MICLLSSLYSFRSARPKVPLAQNFRHVIATEVSKASVDAARWNLMANGVGNVFLARMSSEEFAETMRARGTRRRLKGLAPWEELRLRTVLVDPPRAGLDNFTVELLKVEPQRGCGLRGGGNGDDEDMAYSGPTLMQARGQE